MLLQKGICFAFSTCNPEEYDFPPLSYELFSLLLSLPI